MVTLRKIFHREAWVIGLVFAYDKEQIEKVRSIDARWSATHRLWYVEYNKENYKKIKDILLAEFKIHLRETKGSKDRFVMLPWSVVTYLQKYREMYPGDGFVFQGQYRGEPYSESTVTNPTAQFCYPFA